MTVTVAPGNVDKALASLRASGEAATVIGEIRTGTNGVVIVP